MKHCPYCDKDKDESEFAWKSKAKGTRNNRCKECQKVYAALHYKNNTDTYRDRTNKRRPEARKQGREFLLNYLREHPCVDCGNSDIRVLQFDHKELIGNKAPRVSSHVDSMPALLREIAKCDVRCANCHMIRTAEQLGWTRI